MVIIAVKKWCVKGGKTYGPYPKDSDVWYLYRVFRDGDRVVQEYLGKGPRPKDAVDRQQLRYLKWLESSCTTQRAGAARTVKVKGGGV